jgi:hypothetical protein
MDAKAYGRERIRQARLGRLGTNSPICLFCPEDDPACLERHHLAGRSFGDRWVVIACRNCHRKLSDKQKEHPAVAARDPETLECYGRLLHGIADALELAGVPLPLIEFARETGLRLIEVDRTPDGNGVQPA